MKWIRLFLAEIETLQNKPTKLFNDSSATASWVNQSYISRRAKHIDVPFNTVRNYVQGGAVDLVLIDSKSNIAYCFTKLLSKVSFYEFISSVGLH